MPQHPHEWSRGEELEAPNLEYRPRAGSAEAPVRTGHPAASLVEEMPELGGPKIPSRFAARLKTRLSRL
jgi:hypothetical protein